MQPEPEHQIGDQRQRKNAKISAVQARAGLCLRQQPAVLPELRLHQHRAAGLDAQVECQGLVGRQAQRKYKAAMRHRP